MRLTGNHDILLYDIDPGDQEKIQTILDRNGIQRETDIDPLVRYSMACPALPTCGLAITESERAMPSVSDRIRALLNKLGLENEHFFIRMTGCPNGCARPYMAELGFVGSAPGSYQLWLGGSPNQTRLAQAFIDRMHIDELEKTLEPIFVFFRDERQAGESFGNFCARVGFDAIRQAINGYMTTDVRHTKSTTPTQGRKHRRRVSLSDELYDQLKQLSAEQGRPMTEITAEALEKYLRG
jgi:sulfite reductase (ferredoxin)